MAETEPNLVAALGPLIVFLILAAAFWWRSSKNLSEVQRNTDAVMEANAEARAQTAELKRIADALETRGG